MLHNISGRDIILSSRQGSFNLQATILVVVYKSNMHKLRSFLSAMDKILDNLIGKKKKHVSYSNFNFEVILPFFPKLTTEC